MSEAGGFGCLGASVMGNDEMVSEIAATAALTKKPFGVDLLTAAPQDMAAKVTAIADGGATVFVAGLGVPREVIDLCHERGLLVVNMCGNLDRSYVSIRSLSASSCLTKWVRATKKDWVKFKK